MHLASMTRCSIHLIVRTYIHSTFWISTSLPPPPIPHPTGPRCYQTVAHDMARYDMWRSAPS